MAESDLSPARRVVSLVEIVGLWCLTILQPLLDLVGRNAPFLLHYRLDGVDLAIWIGVVALVPPLVLWLLVELVGWWFGTAARDQASAVVLGVLVVLLALGVLRKLGDPMPAWQVIFDMMSAFGFNPLY